VASPISSTATAPSTEPKASAPAGDTWWRASGRCPVRRITASMSRSRKQFSAFALPAASVPPTMVASTTVSRGRPSAASTMAGSVVTSSSSMMRGLVSAT